MPIKAIILDIGGVIWLPSGSPLSEKWASRCGLDAMSFDRILSAPEWRRQALLGAITREEMWANIGSMLGLSQNDLHELEQDYWKGEWDTTLLDHFQTLKPRYKLGIISDAYTGARELVKEWVNEELFDTIVFSAEEGVCKPDPLIFRIALERLDVEADAVVFVDDRDKNIVGAQQLGIHAIRYVNFSQLLNALDGYIGNGV